MDVLLPVSSELLQAEVGMTLELLELDSLPAPPSRRPDWAVTMRVAVKELLMSEGLENLYCKETRLWFQGSALGQEHKGYSPWLVPAKLRGGQRPELWRQWGKSELVVGVVFPEGPDHHWPEERRSLPFETLLTLCRLPRRFVAGVLPQI